MPGRRVLLPFALAIIALAALVVVPLIIRDRTREVRADILRIADPARQEINTVQLQLTREITALLRFDSVTARLQRQAYRQAKLRVEEAVAHLDTLAPALGPEAVAPLRRVQALLERWHGSVAAAALLDPATAPAVRSRRLVDLLPLYERTTAATVDFALSIQRAIDERTAALADIQQLDFTLTAMLVLLALASALGAGWLAWRLRQAASDAAARLRDLERAQARLQELNESRARLIRGFSHDLKNPLSAADGQAQLVEEGITGELTDQQKDGMRRIRLSIASAFELIDDLLEFARAESGGLEIRSSEMDVRDSVGHVADTYRARAEAKGLTFETELADDLPLIRSDGNRIRQVLGNLVSNAVKYTKEGGVTIRAKRRPGGPGGPEGAGKARRAAGEGPQQAERTRKPEREARQAAGKDARQAASRTPQGAERARKTERGPGENDWVAIEVSDTGPGIPPDKKHLIFREFTRLGSAGGGGAGIGLAISNLIARALGGEITFESERGVGSTFMLWLPVSGGGGGSGGGEEGPGGSSGIAPWDRAAD